MLYYIDIVSWLYNILMQSHVLHATLTIIYLFFNLLTESSSIEEVLKIKQYSHIKALLS